jgi:CubicO group peptidase (beta-lactamase class C family)
MKQTKKISLERAKFPEEVGVSSKATAAFIKDLNDCGIEAHSLMIIRHGKVAFECWAQPLTPDLPHIMYSVSKSITSTAIGFAIEEGILSLQTRLVDIFPEYKPKKTDENLEKVTVYHLLTMTAGKDVPTLSDKSKNRWIQDFFDAKWAFAPGDFWRYISENTFMLCAMLTRVTGISVTEYLTPRLFEPLGYDRVPFWEKDGYGIEAGGWGMYLTTEELAKFMLCYQQGGVFNGKQIIPKNWAKEAVKKQVENLQYDDPPSTAGYGYGFWRNPVQNSYRADGLFSQFGMVFEDDDACFVMTANEIFEDKARDCVLRHFPGVFEEPCMKKPKDTPPAEQLELKSLPNLAARPHSRLEKRIDGKILKIKSIQLLEKAGFPVSMIMAPVLQMNFERLGDIKEARFRFTGDVCEMTWREGLFKNTIECGMDGKPRFSKIRLSQFDFTACSTAAWENENTLCIWMRPLEAIGQRRIKFMFSGDKVTMSAGGIPDGKTTMKYLSGFVGFFIKPAIIVKAAKLILSKGETVVEPRHKGRLRR